MRPTLTHEPTPLNARVHGLRRSPSTPTLAGRVRCGSWRGSVTVSGCRSGWTPPCDSTTRTRTSTCRTWTSSPTSARCWVRLGSLQRERVYCRTRVFVLTRLLCSPFFPLVVNHRHRQAGLLFRENYRSADWWESSVGGNWKRRDHLHPTDRE